MKKGKKPASPRTAAKRWKIVVGDVRKVAAEMAEEQPRTFDAILCDPPYDLSFMNKAWDASGVAFDVALWRDLLRLLRPGGHLLAAGGTRTFHRMVTAVEDAGFEIRDCIAWIQGQGFPKSANVSKALDKKAGAKRKVIGTQRLSGTAAMSIADKGGTFTSGNSSKGVPSIDIELTAPATHAARTWDGYGTALKPAWEGWTLARKPSNRSTFETAHVHGTGALNIEGCRISTSDDLNGGAYSGELRDRDNESSEWSLRRGVGEYKQPSGRWPSNVLFDESAASSLGDASRFFYVPKVGTAERNAGLSSEPPHGPLDGRKPGSRGTKSPRAGANRNGGALNPHPTLKPIALTTYLARLLLPPKNARSLDKPRRILVPFAGAGSEAIGALLAGWDEVIGIELSSEYARIARKRIAHHVRESDPGKGALYESLKKKGKKP